MRIQLEILEAREEFPIKELLSAFEVVIIRSDHNHALPRFQLAPSLFLSTSQCFFNSIDARPIAKESGKL